MKGELIPHLVRHQHRSSTNTAGQGLSLAMEFAIAHCYYCCLAMKAAASLYIDEVQEKALEMSSCGNGEDWWHQTMRCHACVVESPVCVRVNTIPSFQEANRLIPHNLPDFQLQKLSNDVISSRSKVH